MDTFFEQIKPIKKNAKMWLLFVAITVLALALLTFSIVVLRQYGIIFDFLIVYGAYTLYKRLSVEYEYIVTNDSFDVDKIIGKSSRKRVLSFEIPEISKLNRCDFSSIPQGNFAKKIIACNKLDNPIYSLVVKGRQGDCLLIFSPNDRIREGLARALPKHIDKDVLKIVE